MPSAATAGPDGASDIAAHRARIGKKYARRRVERPGMTSSLASIELSHHGKSVGKPKDEAIDNKQQAKSLSSGEYLDQSLRGRSISIWSRARPRRDCRLQKGAGGKRRYLAAAFAATAFFRPALALVLQRLAHLLEFLRSALSTRGKFRSRFSSALTMAEPITTRANHL